MNATSALTAYGLLLLVGFLPSIIWRVLGLIVVRGAGEDSELFLWARAVATAVFAGVTAKIVLFPPGALAEVPLAIRFTAIACGLGAFYAVRRSVFAGVVVGEAILMIGASLTQ